MTREWKWKSKSGKAFFNAGYGRMDAVGAEKPSESIPLQEGTRLLFSKGIDRIWLVALAGIVIKVCWLDAPRWLYTSLYILMGWSILVDPKSLGLIDPRCLAMIAAGGVAYTIGAVIYILKKPNITEEFGFHEIFHCFILLGTLLQFVGIAFFI